MVDMLLDRLAEAERDLEPRPAPRRVAEGWRAAQVPAGADARRHQFLLRFALVNAAALALAAASYGQGHVTRILAADESGLSVAIFAAFLAGLAVAARRAWQVSSDLGALSDPCPPAESVVGRYLARIGAAPAESRALIASGLRLRLTARIAAVRLIANSLVLLGLIGTVIGFILALSGVDPDTVGDASSIAPMVSTLIQGMSVALYTTLVGAVLNIWLTVNYHLLAGATARLLAGLVEQGESDGRL